eukprot:3939552-Rhodomonas_salina.5
MPLILNCLVPTPICLRACCEKSDTDIAVPCSQAVVSRYHRCPPVHAYRRQLPNCLRACYAKPGTDISCSLRNCYKMPGTGLAYGASDVRYNVLTERMALPACDGPELLRPAPSVDPRCVQQGYAPCTAFPWAYALPVSLLCDVRDSYRLRLLLCYAALRVYDAYSARRLLRNVRY